MPSYVCKPSATTVAPCPTGMAPEQAIYSTQPEPIFYPGRFDGMPPQDVMVTVALVVAFILGVGQGRR